MCLLTIMEFQMTHAFSMMEQIQTLFAAELMSVKIVNLQLQVHLSLEEKDVSQSLIIRDITPKNMVLYL